MNAKSRMPKAVPKFLVDDANKAIESILNGATTAVDRQAQSSVNEITSDIINDFVRVLIDDTTQEMLHEPINEMKPEQLLKLMGVTLKEQAKKKLDPMVDSNSNNDSTSILLNALKSTTDNFTNKLIDIAKV